MTWHHPLLRAVLICSCVCLFLAAPCLADERPNILWLTAEDMSPTLGCYGDEYATTPHLDRLAAQSVRYTRAFATAPVCSPSRSCLITGCYAPSLGTHQMRSTFPIPDAIRGFPALLREAGYFTTNNSKTDYNTSTAQRLIQESWDQNSAKAHWRNRKRAGQPFFSVFNFMTSHQSRSMAWPYQQFKTEVQSKLEPGEVHDPDNAPVPPYYPDTRVIRRTIARYYDCVTAMDKQVGDILRQLEENGLAENTIVMFYSDHGSGMPRHKRALLETGMRVPLLIHFPKKYRHLAPAAPGETTDRLVSFVDFGPTVLSLAGVTIPAVMQGRPFLGAQQPPPRRYVFGHRDRIDEAFDTARSVRDGRYLYVRNYMPHLSYHQPSAWPDTGEIRHEFYRLARAGGMTPPQRHYAGPTRLVEELYDCKTDPLNLKNLADAPEHQQVLKRLRRVHRQHIRDIKDLGFIPEAHAWRVFAATTPWQSARARNFKFDELYRAAWAVGTAQEQTFLEQLADARASVRYWGAIGLAGKRDLSPVAVQKLRATLTDDSAAVRIAAADALGRASFVAEALPVLTDALQAKDLNVALQGARVIELFGPDAKAAEAAMRALGQRCDRIQTPSSPVAFDPSGEQDLAMFCGFSVQGFLARLGR